MVAILEWNPRKSLQEDQPPSWIFHRIPTKAPPHKEERQKRANPPPTRKATNNGPKPPHIPGWGGRGLL